MQPGTPSQPYPGAYQPYQGVPSAPGWQGAYTDAPSAPFAPAAPRADVPSSPSSYSGDPRPPLESHPVAAVVPPAPPADPPRRALLAAMLYNPLLLVGYLTYLYGPTNRCVAGPVCNFGELHPLLQGLLLLVLAGVLWGVVAFIIHRTLEAPGWHGRIVGAVRAITDYRHTRPLLGLYGVAMLFALLVGVFAWRLTPAALIFGSVSAITCLRCALARDLAPPPTGVAYTPVPLHAVAPGAGAMPPAHTTHV